MSTENNKKNNDSIKLVFKSEEEPIYISLNDCKLKNLTIYLLDNIMPLTTDKAIMDDILKVTYPKDTPKNRADHIKLVEGIFKNYNIPVEESKIDIWEANNGFGGKIDLETFMSAEYLTLRNFDMEDENDMEIARQIYALQEETKAKFRALKAKSKNNIFVPQFHYHSNNSKRNNNN